jgi:hypothetical protein
MRRARGSSGGGFHATNVHACTLHEGPSSLSECRGVFVLGLGTFGTRLSSQEAAVKGMLWDG